MEEVLPWVLPSLSARRAWIEMQDDGPSFSVHESLSARRAWIEMDWSSVISAMTSVALRKESVDRNVKITSVSNGLKRRSPQGERG